MNTSSFTTIIGDNLMSGEYNLHSNFLRVINFTDDVNIFSLVMPEIGEGANNIVVARLPEDCPEKLIITKDYISFNNVILYCRDCKIYNSTPQSIKIPSKKFVAEIIAIALPFIKNEGLAFIFDETKKNDLKTTFEKIFAHYIEIGISHLIKGEILEGVYALKGCGGGLTPVGDDFLCGFFAGLWLNKQMNNDFLDAALGDNLLSNSFLMLSSQGKFFVRFKNVVEALMSEDKNLFLKSIKPLVNVGDSSGSAMLVGLLFSLKDF